MKIRMYTEFGALNSAPVFAAMAQGLRHHGMTVTEQGEADVAVIWSLLWAGRMRRNREIWQQYRNTGRHVISLEVGLKRGLTWRISVDGNPVYMAATSQRRPELLELNLQPWRSSGQNIVIALQRPESLQWQGQPDPAVWVTQVLTRIRAYTDRPVSVRCHPRSTVNLPSGVKVEMPRSIPDTYDEFDFADSLNTAWAVINHNSNPGVEAILAGVPAFVDRSSRAAPVGNIDLTMIESPSQPDRTAWFERLCHSEWLLPEISAGAGLDHVIACCH